MGRRRAWQRAHASTSAVERDGHGTQEVADVSGRDRVEEALMMGLRLSDGIDRAHFMEVNAFDRLIMNLGFRRAERFEDGDRGFLC